MRVKKVIDCRSSQLRRLAIHSDVSRGSRLSGTGAAIAKVRPRLTA